MYAYITGELTYKSPTYVIIETNGIGYEVNISLTTYDQIVNLNDCKLYTHFAVKEDAQVLYGFYQQDEKQLFEHLINVSGIGPNSARMILSSTGPDAIKKAIIDGNVSLLKSIKGIGAKSGQRIIVELQDVLKKQYREESAEALAQSGGNQYYEEAQQGLVMLGFKKEEADKALSKVMKQGSSEMNTEELIKHALKIL